jgi:putative transposase
MYMETNCNIAFDCKYHVVWCTKYRRGVLSSEIEAALKQIVSDVCEERNATILEMEGDSDHFHLLVAVDPQYGIHRLVKQIKGRSSFVLRGNFPELKRKLPTLWTNSYFVATVGGAPLAAIKQYIEQQKGK